MKFNFSCHSTLNMNLDFCSRLNVDRRLYFGGFPSKQQLLQLKDIGVKYIVDCTTIEEKRKLDVYNAKDYGFTYIHYPILDNFIPTDIRSFKEFIRWLSFLIQQMSKTEQIYIHCKGGHGRSGLVMACILCFLYRFRPSDSIKEITRAHIERKILSPKWKNRLCPSNEIQRIFIHNLFPFTYYRTSLPTKDHVYFCPPKKQQTSFKN
jgi:protein-tyrosine phosphatase